MDNTRSFLILCKALDNPRNSIFPSPLLCYLLLRSRPGKGRKRSRDKFRNNFISLWILQWFSNLFSLFLLIFPFYFIQFPAYLLCYSLREMAGKKQEKNGSDQTSYFSGYSLFSPYNFLSFSYFSVSFLISYFILINFSIIFLPFSWKGMYLTKQRDKKGSHYFF